MHDAGGGNTLVFGCAVACCAGSGAGKGEGGGA